MDAQIEDRDWDVVAIGDSIIGKEREDGKVEEYFTAYSGLTMLNGAFGGNCASVGENAYRYSYHEESLTLYGLAKAVCYRDFGVQWADLAASQTKIWYFEEVLSGLARADLRRTKLLLLVFGSNDYMAGRKLDDSENPYNAETYGGALRYAIELFQKTYPNLSIALATPPFSQNDEYGTCLEADFGGGTLDQYADLGKEIAAEYGLVLVDAFYELGFDETNVKEYTEDGMHLNQAGRQKYARFLAEKLGEEKE